MRRILRFLWEHHGAQKLDHYVRRYPGVRPRNVTVTDDERAQLLTAAPDYLRLLILLCSDLAIRSGTALNLGPGHYDSQRRTLTFTTKMGERLSLPTTAEIETMLDSCDMRSADSFVRQLWRHHPRVSRRAPLTANALRIAFHRLRLRVGITRSLHLHDLRRTTAVAIYKHTGDLRDAQALLGHRSLAATLHYLDHDLRPVKRSVLEIIKSPAWRKEQSA